MDYPKCHIRVPVLRFVSSPFRPLLRPGKGSFQSLGYVVSSIGSHWGVLVNHGNSQFLYHLVFQNRGDAATDMNPNSLTGKIRPIMFNAILWENSETNSISRKVGHTRYTTDELVKIGELIRLRRSNVKGKS